MNFARRLAAHSLVLLASVTALSASAASGDLDATFGVGGVAYIPQPVSTGQPDSPRAIVRQSTGKFVVVGNDSVVARLAADGTLDATFGSAGRTALRDAQATSFATQAAAVTASDQVLVLGDSTGAHSVLYRLDANGAPDVAFGAGGRLVLDFSGAGLAVSSFARIAVQPDGKLLLGGTDGASHVVARLNANGTPDATFGTGGVTVPGAGHVAALALYGDGRIAYGSGNRIFRLSAAGAVDGTLPAGTSIQLPAGVYLRDLAAQPDGKLVAAYTADFFGTTATIARFTAAGIPDQDEITGFGALLTGYREGVVASPVRSPSLLVRPEGIVLAGYVPQVDGFDSLLQNQAATARLLANGELDMGFGVAGIAASALPPVTPHPGNDGGGYASWQFAALGTWGTAILGERDGDLKVFLADGAGVVAGGPFGSSGLATLDLGRHERHRARAIARQADGRILVAGCLQVAFGCDSLVYRLNADGSVDGTFGTGGRFTANLGGDDQVNGLAVQADGAILLAGRATDANGPLFLMARLTAAGALDATFNGTGTNLLRLEGGSGDEAVGVGIQSSGKPVFGGTSVRVAGTDFAAVRLNADGTLDATFGTAGRRLVDSGSGVVDIARTMAVISGDRIALAGSSNYSTYSANFATGSASVLVLTANGTPDVAFGAAGGSPGWRMGEYSHIGYAAEEALAIAEAQDGSLRVVGAAEHRSNSGPNIFMYYPYPWIANLPAATQDEFVVSGVQTSTPTDEGRLHGVAFSPDGRQLLGGEALYTTWGPGDSGIVQYADGLARREDVYGGNWSAIQDFEDGSDDRGGQVLALPDGKAVHAFTVNDRAIVLTRRDGVLRESPTATLSVTPTTMAFGDAVTATITVTGVTRRPTGFVGFASYLSCNQPLPPGAGLVVTVNCPAEALPVAGDVTLTAYYSPDTPDLEFAQTNSVDVTVTDVAVSAAIVGVKVRGVATNQLPQPLYAEVEVEARDAAGNPVSVGNAYEVALGKVSGTGNLASMYPGTCNLIGAPAGEPSRCTLYLRWDTVENGIQVRAIPTSLTALPSLPPTAPVTLDVVAYDVVGTAIVTGPASLVAGEPGTFDLWIAPDGQLPYAPPTGTVDFRIGGVPVAGCQGLAWGYGSSPEFVVGNYRARCTTVQSTVAAAATTFEAVYAGDGGYLAAAVSKPLAVTAAASASIELVSGSGQSNAPGSSLAQPLRAVVRDSFGNAAPGRGVSFVAPTSGASVLLLNGGQATTGADGIAAMGGIAAGEAGSFAVLASAAGVSGTVSFSLTNTAPAPAIFLASGNNPSLLGASVILTATVVTTGGPVPTGTVTFLDGATTLGTASLAPSGSGASASFAVSSLPVGAYTLTARYEGDANWAMATSGPVAQTVNPATAGVSVSSSANPSTFGGSVTFTATVGGTSPTGTVQFHDGTTALGAPVALSGGQASIVLTTLGVGLHAVTGTYSGDANHQASTSLPAIQVVNRAMPAFSIASNLDAAPAGASVTFSVALASSTAMPTGFVVFRNAGVEFAAATVVNGVATLTTASLPAGTNAIQAEYSGDGNFEPSLSATISIPIGPLDPAGDADRDAIPNGVEAGEGRNPLAKDNDVFTDARLFAMQQYRDFLNREGDPAGVQGWSAFVAGGTYSRNQVIDAFLGSDEFAGFVAPVVRLYFATFLRVPDYAGLMFNAGLVRAGTITPTQLAEFFTVSPEFAATYGSLDDTQFVTLLYANVLGRAPDPAGLAGWVSLLGGGYTRGQVLIGFSDSAEYQGRMANEVFVTMMYAGMLRRTPEPAGFNGWVGFLDAGTYTREQVINGFFLSTEYYGRFLP